MLLKGLTPAWMLKLPLLWLLCLVRSWRSRYRYIPLGLPWLKVQVLLFKDGLRWVVFSIRDVVDWNTAREVFWHEDYSIRGLMRYEELKGRYEQIVSTGRHPLIIDCGGNIGLASRYFSLEFPAAKVVCVEPDPENAHYARLNNSTAVECVCAAVGPENSRGSMQDPGLGGNAYRLVDQVGGETEILSINTLLARFADANHAPFLIKIDIEGFERDLFSNNVDWIDRFPLLMIELHDWMLPGQANSRSFLTEVARRNRDFVQVGGNILSVANDE